MSDSVILLVFNFAFVIVTGFFVISTLISYKKQKAKLALYLSLVFLTQLVFFVLMIIRYIENIIMVIKTPFYSQITFFGQIFIVMSMIFSIPFYNEFSSINKNLKYYGYIVGLLIILYILLPMNYDTSNRFYNIMAYVFMMIYGVVIYGVLSRHFYKLSKKTIEKKRETQALLLGMILFLIYFIYSAMTANLIDLMIITIIKYSIHIAILVCFFLGIYFPKLKFRKK